MPRVWLTNLTYNIPFSVLIPTPEVLLWSLAKDLATSGSENNKYRVLLGSSVLLYKRLRELVGVSLSYRIQWLDWNHSVQEVGTSILCSIHAIIMLCYTAHEKLLLCTVPLGHTRVWGRKSDSDYASIMLDAKTVWLCSITCWRNMLVPIRGQGVTALGYGDESHYIFG